LSIRNALAYFKKRVHCTFESVISLSLGAQQTDIELTYVLI